MVIKATPKTIRIATAQQLIPNTRTCGRQASPPRSGRGNPVLNLAKPIALRSSAFRAGIDIGHQPAPVLYLAQSTGIADDSTYLH
jgi:hypothetical protein